MAEPGHMFDFLIKGLYCCIIDYEGFQVRHGQNKEINNFVPCPDFSLLIYYLLKGNHHVIAFFSSPSSPATITTSFKQVLDLGQQRLTDAKTTLVNSLSPTIVSPPLLPELWVLIEAY